MNSLDEDGGSLLSSIERASPNIVWFVDVDDTLTDTAKMHSAGAKSLRRGLSQVVGQDDALAITDSFESIFNLLIVTHQAGRGGAGSSRADQALYENTVERILACQRDIRRRWGVTKRFSREVLLYLAAQDCGVTLSGAQIQTCVDQYWSYIGENVILFKDGLDLARAITSVGSPIYLITSSDGRFSLGGDGQFDYDPDYSRSFKAARLEALRAAGVAYRQAFIGDPVDKPDPAFFAEAYSSVVKDLGRPLGSDRVVVVGDSFSSDIETPISEWSEALGIHYRHGQAGVRAVGDRVLSVGDLGVVASRIARR